MASGHLCKTCGQRATGCAGESSGVCDGGSFGASAGKRAGENSAPRPGVLAGRLPVHNPRVGADAFHTRAMFPEHWSAWCRETFGTNPVTLAAAFNISEKAARMWLSGTSGPNGWAVAHAIATIPGAAEALVRRAA